MPALFTKLLLRPKEISLILTLLCVLNYHHSIGQICNPNGNLVIFSNYEGGTLTVNCDVNIPNLKIGIVTYESPVVNFIGPFANQITEVIYAGFGGTGSCTGNVDVEINGVDPSIVTIYTNDQPAISPFLGEPIFPGSPALVNCMTSGGGCTTSTADGGNSSNQIVQFFLAEFAPPVVFRSHFTQYNCWGNIEEAISLTGNCCIADPTTPPNPIYVSPAAYDLIPVTEFSLCDGPVTVFIPYEVLFQPPVYSGYVWSNGATGQTVTFTEPGIYTVTAGDYCHFGSNAILEDEVEIVECLDSPLLVDVLAPGIACAGVPFQIEGSISGGFPPYTISWFPNIGVGLGPFEVTASSDFDYALSVQDIQGNSFTIGGTVQIIGSLDVAITGDFDLCDGQATLTAESANATSFLWSTGAAVQTINVSSPGTYSVTVSSSCGSVSDNIFLAACNPDLAVSIEGENQVCAGFPSTVEAVISGGVAPYSIIWNQGLGNTAGPFVISPTVNTTYTVSVIDADGTAMSASLSVTLFTTILSLDLGPDITFCSDSPQQIGATVENAILYIWSNGAGTPFIQPSVSGTYILQASDLCSTVSDEIGVTVINANPTVFDRTFRLCEGDSLRIGPPESDQYVVAWNTGANTDGISVVESGAYGGVISNLCGTNTFTVNVNFVDCSCNIFIPNAFTPNMDGANDLFGIETICKLKNYELLVFDRLGAEVFSTNDPEISWNGSYQGDTYFCEAGVYSYFLKAEQDTDLFVPEPLQLRGSVMLVR